MNRMRNSIYTNQRNVGFIRIDFNGRKIHFNSQIRFLRFLFEEEKKNAENRVSLLLFFFVPFPLCIYALIYFVHIFVVKSRN